MKKIAVVTGASGGMGQVFVRELAKEALDEIWIIGRKENRLLMLRNEWGERIRPVCMDLTKNTDLSALADLLKEQNPSVMWLVNNAGMARMAPSGTFSFSEIEQTIGLNCKVPASARQTAPPKTDNENLAAWHKRLFIIPAYSPYFSSYLSTISEISAA